MTSKALTEIVEPFGFKSEGFSYEAYSHVAMTAQLEDIRLVDSTYQMTPDIFFDTGFDPSKLANRLSHEIVGMTYDPEGGVLVGGFIWHAEMRVQRKKALSLKSNYFAAYSNLPDCDERYVSLYFRKVAKFATFPYFRALFSGQTAASGLALPPLPSLRERID